MRIACQPPLGYIPSRPRWTQLSACTMFHEMSLFRRHQEKRYIGKTESTFQGPKTFASAATAETDTLALFVALKFPTLFPACISLGLVSGRLQRPQSNIRSSFMDTE